MRYDESDSGGTNRTDRPVVDERIGRFPQRLEAALKGRVLKKVAADAQLSVSVMRNYLRGETFPTLDRLAGLAVALGVSVEWLVTGEQSHGEIKEGAAADPALSGNKDHTIHLKEATVLYLGLLEEIGFDPGSMWSTLIVRLMVEHGLTEKGAVAVLETLKYLRNREQGGS